MAVTLNVTFDLVSNDHAGDIRLYAANVNEVPVGDLKVYWGVTGPDGVVLKAFPSTPDATFVGTSETFVRIPKESNGDYLRGDYMVRVLFTDTGDDNNDPQIFAAANLAVTFQPYNSGRNPDSDYIVTLEADYNCDTGNITATGSVIHPATISLSDDEISVTPEAATGEDAYSSATDIINSGIVIFYHTNADYVVTYRATAEVEFGVEETYTVYWLEDISISTTLNVQCTLPDLCKVASCLEKEFKALEAKTCGKGWESLTENEKGKFNKAAALARLILLYKGCGNDTKYRAYVTKFETLMDCSCGCGDEATTADDPIPYAAPNLFID